MHPLISRRVGISVAITLAITCVLPVPSALSQTTAKPTTSQPGTAKPQTAQPGTAQPGTAQPGTAKPGTAKPGTAQPGTAKPGTAKPGTAKPAPRTAAPQPKPAPASKPEPPALVAAPKPPPAPVPQDVRYKTTYGTGDQRTESVSFIKGERQRFEFADMILIAQRDQKRTVQISRAARTYLIVADGAVAAPVAVGVTPARPKGVVTLTTSIVDTGERKQAFGREARHVKTTMDLQPMPGACDETRQHIETDGWYVDVPATLPPSGLQPGSSPTGDCADEIKATTTGDATALGFPIGYTMRVTGADGKPTVVTMEISELEVATLDAALFEIPAGLTAAGDFRALSKAVSDANEATLAAAPPTPARVVATPGSVRVGVPELTNSSGIDVDTRALRTRLIADLMAAQLDAEPLAAGSTAEQLQRAAERRYDYVLVVDVSELKVPRGGLGGALRAASRVTGPAAAAKDPTEATIAVKLLQPDGKSKLAATKKGKDGGGLDVKTGLGLAKFAGSMYVNMLTGRAMLSSMNSMTARNLSGMGMLGNPTLMNVQSRGLGAGGLGLGMGRGLDTTATAASFLIAQAMANEAPAAGGGPGQTGPSFDAALADALGEAAKAISESVKKAR